MRPTIGLIGPESLARALTDRGAQIATAREPKDAARIIRERDDLACVLITGPPDPVLTAWATAVGSRTEVVAVGAGWPGRVLASVNPARAGMILRPIIVHPPIRSKPRASGDDPSFFTENLPLYS